MTAHPTTTAPGAGARARMWIEQHPYLALFLLAMGVRAVVLAGIQIGYDGSLFLDDLSYSRMAAAQADGATERWSEYDHWLYTRAGALLVPLTVLYEIFGASTLVGQVYVALAGAGVAVLTMRVAAEALPMRAAAAAGVIVALMPSQVLWSSIILKDALVWLVLAGLAVVAAIAGRTAWPRLLPLWIGAAALLTALGFLRLHTLVIASWALVVAAALSVREDRIRRVLGALAVAVVIPWAFGGGPAGLQIIIDESRSLDERRAANALLADSAFVDPDAGDRGGTRRTYERIDGGALPADVRHLPVGVSAVLLRPYPWQQRHGSVALRLAAVENIVWYVLLVLAAVGLWSAWRRRRVLAFPVAAGGAILIAYALTEGNVGTAFRHRGEIVWIVALLATVGGVRLLAMRRGRAGAGQPDRSRPELSSSSR